MIENQAKTLLVVEDDEDIQFALKMFLEDEGFQVFAAENGSIALEHLSRRGLPDLILLDMMMPVMNGADFAHAFKKQYPNCGVPLVVMTATQDGEQRAKELGVVGWIRKPFNLADLRALIKKSLG